MSAHVLHDSAIPKRLRRYVDVQDAVVVTSPFTPLPGVRPDYVLATRKVELEPHGRTGMTLRDDDAGVTVQAINRQSAAEKAGIEIGDLILRIGDEPIRRLSDVRLSLTDSAPGDRLRLQLRRGPSGSTRTLTKVLTLL